MSVRVALMVTLLMTVFLPGCYTGAGTASKGDAALVVATPFQGDVPAGVVTPRPVIGAYEGIYKQQGDEPCCWITQDASFQTRVSPHAKTLLVTVILPDVALYKERPQALTVRISGQSAITFPNLAVGESTLRVPLKAKTGHSIVNVRLHAAYAFVPKRENLNDDTRLLSMYLTDVHGQ